jgi:hypothetical protein
LRSLSRLVSLVIISPAHRSSAPISTLPPIQGMMSYTLGITAHVADIAILAVHAQVFFQTICN